MIKLINKIKQTKSSIKNLDLSNDKKAVAKSILFSNLLYVIILIPFVLIFLELFKQYPIISPVFYILLVIVFLLLYFSLPLSQVFYIILLKNYIESDSITTIKTKDVYVMELFNIVNILVSIGFVVIIYFGMRVL